MSWDTIPEDPTSANNANIRQRAQKTMTLVRFLKCHQIWATFILSDFMVNCLSDNATRSRFTASHFFTYCQCPTCGWTIRSIHRMTILNSSEDPGHWLRCASTSAIYATQTASSPTKKMFTHVVPIYQDSVGFPCQWFHHTHEIFICIAMGGSWDEPRFET